MDASTQIYPYLNALERAFDSEAVHQVKPLFRLDNPLLHQALFALGGLSDAQLHGICKRKLDTPWLNVVYKHLKAAQQRADGKPSDAFDIYVAADGPLKIMSGCLTSDDYKNVLWVAAVFEQLLANVLALASETDRALGLVEEDSKFKELGGFLQPMGHELGGQHADARGKARGNLAQMIAMTRVYTKLNNMAQCSQLLKAFTVLFTKDVVKSIPASARVSANFYMGRTEVAGGHIEQGLQLLERAFMECPLDSRNMQAILRFLVPLKMLHGLLPPESWLQQYDLGHYLVFRQAISTGDVGLYERSMQELTLKMVADGTYLLWDLLIFHVYRRLVKRIYDMERPTRDEKVSNQLSLETMLGVLQQQGASTSMDELECMLTVAISSKYIKGYISNKQKVLVLSRVEAFPSHVEDWWTPITAGNAGLLPVKPDK